jgi:hypothetical protein
MSIENQILLGLVLVGTSTYTVYTIKKRREEIRKTIQVIELKDVDFWQDLTQFRELVPVRA